MIKPKRLEKGGRIAVISPSSGLPYAFPGIYELGLANLKEIFGFEVVEMPTARMSREELYKNPKLRAEDINDAFADNSIDGIISSIGGYESVRILKYLDTEMIKKHPKMIMGFSDSSTFLTYLNSLGMITFNGPSIMAGFAQLKYLPKEQQEHIEAILFEKQYPYAYKAFPRWTQGYKSWSDPELTGQCKEFYENSAGWHFLQGQQAVQGRLWGGCIEVLEFLKGTDYWPGADFWDDKILFFETSEDKPTPDNVGYMLRNYGIQGILGKVKGILFGRPKDYSEAENQELHDIIRNMAQIEFNIHDLPIAVNVDFGHTAPQFIMPLGILTELNPQNGAISLLESPFQEE